MQFEQALSRIAEKQYPIDPVQPTMREQLVGDEGSIKAKLLVGGAAVGLVAAGVYAFLNGWGQHIDVETTTKVEASHITLPGKVDIVTMGVNSRLGLAVNFHVTTPSLFGKNLDIPEGTIFGCANRAGNINLKMVPTTNSDENKVTLNPDNTDKNYKFQVIDDGGGNEHLRLYVDPYKAFEVERAEMSTVPDPTCETGSNGLISETRSLEPITASRLQTNLDSTADQLPEIQCPATIAESGVVSIAIQKWARTQLQSAMGLVKDELTADNPHVPGDVQAVVDKLSALANGDIEVWYTPNPNSPNADLTQNLGLTAAPFTHRPTITDKQIVESEGINTDEITDYSVQRVGNCDLSAVAAGDVKDIIATAKKQQAEYEAKYHQAIGGGS